jgi:hypothetical protein
MFSGSCELLPQLRFEELWAAVLSKWHLQERRGEKGQSGKGAKGQSDDEWVRYDLDNDVGESTNGSARRRRFGKKWVKGIREVPGPAQPDE